MEKYNLTHEFRGNTVCIAQEPRERTDKNSDNTGWTCWEASNVILRFVAHDDDVVALLGKRKCWNDIHFLDLSAGAGLIAIACAAAGAQHVVACDIPDQVPQLLRNVVRNDVAVDVLPYWWGTPIQTIKPPWHSSDVRTECWYDLVFCSDILYIALRDKRTDELEATVREIAVRAAVIVFSFEERLPQEEQQFMLKLGLDDAMAPLDVLEVKGAAVEVTQETALQGAGGHADTDLFNPALFWEPPPIRLFLLRARDRRIVTDLTC